ncbi:MAG: hypothetical protein IJW77_00595 [Clostridia bacterium]|nr:hypothetical protein [Clostridia bacterium]
MKTKLIRSIALVLAMIMCMAVGAFAATNLQEIKAYLNYDLAIRYDGELQTMYDANGKQVVPISYNGTTYLPIRAVGNMMGIDVLWDGENYQVLLGKTGQAIDFIENFTPYSNTFTYEHRKYSDGKTYQLGDKTYSHFIAMNNSNYYGEGYYDLAGKYESLTFDIYSTEDQTVNIYGDNGQLLAAINVIGNDLPKTYTINIKGVQQLAIKQSLKRMLMIFDAYVE